MTNPTFTLADIRNTVPGAYSWTKLLRSLGYGDGQYDPDCRIGLGDVARSNGAADALWCVRCLDWSDVSVRRAVISGAVLPTVKRASAHSTDTRVHDCIAAVERWCAGDDSADLQAAAEAALVAAEAAWAAARAAARAAAVADAAARAAAAAARAARAAREASEREQQRADIMTAFPPVRLLMKEEDGSPHPCQCDRCRAYRESTGREAYV